MAYEYNKNNVDIVNFSEFVLPVQNKAQPSPFFPDKKVLAEGDSWFHIGGSAKVGSARNLIDELNFNDKHTMLLNMALTGDTVRRISESFDSSNFKKMLEEEKWDFILLSAGGNDLIDALTEDLNYIINGKNISIIQSSKKKNGFMSYINKDDLKIFLKFILEEYRALFEIIRNTDNREVPIIIHTYDYPTPRNSAAKIFGFNAKGPWLFKALDAKKVPTNYWIKISDYIFEQLADALLTLHSPNLPNVANVYVVKTHGTLLRADSVAGESYDWLNEIHPNAKGIQKLANLINKEIASIIN